jgi:hypothetical protein
LVQSGLALVLLVFTGCSLLVDFDRSRIAEADAGDAGDEDGSVEDAGDDAE